MSQFLNRVRDVDPNDSEAVKEAITGFFQNLPKHKDVDCNRWLRALENVINRFPKYCGQHRGTIENYLSHFLDSSHYYNVIEAAKCAHSVQQVRPQQEKTASAKSCWRDQMSSLCEAAHVLINAIYSRSASIYNKNGNPKKNESQAFTSPLLQTLSNIDTASKTNDIANKTALLCTRLRNVLVFIQAMLVEIYPVAKPVQPQTILEVILQSLSASGNEDSSDVTMIKVQALRVLDAIVSCLGSNLIPFSALVFRFVMQTLRWSSEHPSEETRKVRCAAYNSLTKWLLTLHTHRESNDARPWDTELTSHVVTDVTPRKHIVQLIPNAQPMKNLSKKARKKLANSLLMQSNISTHMPGEKNKIVMNEESNDELAIAALECAEAFLTTCGIFLKPTTHKVLQELLVRECYSLDRCSAERGIWLLRALEACRKSCSPKVPPPTQYCLQLYGVLVNNSRTEVSKFASQALLDIRLHLHCSPPSLNFALEEPPEKTIRDEKRKRLSERNRAVLESLLGKERMPSEDLAEKEVITIPDEPSIKRARVESDSEQISVSSESVASIEISDSSSVEEIEEETELDDSTDYIIEPPTKEQSSQDTFNSIDIDSNTNLDVQVIDQNSQDMSTAVKVTDKIDEIDGKIVDDDAETVILSQIDQESTPTQSSNIYDAITQLPTVFDANEHERSSPTKSQLSLEVAYDYPNTGQEKVTVLEKMDEDNLPSTNDSDDVQITCGQVVKNSQDVNSESKEAETNEVPKVNGIDKSPERNFENGDATSSEIEGSVAAKIVLNDAEVTVEDMLADFVDEVNDESPAQIPA